jgi:hypothetical protein
MDKEQLLELIEKKFTQITNECDIHRLEQYFAEYYGENGDKTMIAKEILAHHDAALSRCRRELNKLVNPDYRLYHDLK